MDSHRRVNARHHAVIPFDQPFSSFNYVDSNYGTRYPAIRRLFSLARSEEALTLVIEKIDPLGIIADENEEIASYCPGYRMSGLDRVSFWDKSFRHLESRNFKTAGCVGYAILKHDEVASQGYDRWHIFEAVFKKYPHPHNCVPKPMKYDVKVGGRQFKMEGLLYAQQNSLNKACAQVALRSLISRITSKDISYREINNLARNAKGVNFNPGLGLDPLQIQAVLKGLGIKYRDFDYSQGTARDRKRIPFQKYVYSGIESGAGALVGFRLSGARERHIIPFYGHTFNKDTWAPDANVMYFRVGRQLGYVPSENWTSSFLGHDDNFGPNFCVPRLYIPTTNVDYVVELLAPGFVYGGTQAEALALKFLYAVLDWFRANGSHMGRNPWLKRLTSNVATQQIVLRAVAVDKKLYVKHLTDETDWAQHAEDRRTVSILDRFLPRNLYVVEVSIPQLFPANKRKIGDIVLDGSVKIDAQIKRKKKPTFLFVRLPSLYLINLSTDGDTNLLRVPSDITSHFPVMQLML